MNFPKKILVVYFSQSGQLESIIQQIVRPLQGSGHTIHFHKIEPITPFPFPWTSDQFFSAFPDSFNETGFPLKPLEVKEINFDLIILGYSPWFLSPSIPTSSFLQSQNGREILNGKKVITIIGCRNMWIQAQEKIKKQLLQNQALLVGNIVLRDKNQNLISVLTIIRWLINGKKEKSFFLPAAGISAMDIQGSEEFGEVINASLLSGNFQYLQQRLIEKKAIEVFPNLMLFEKNGNKIFSLWAKKIQSKRVQGDAKNLLWTRLFKYYLIAVLFVVSPIGSFIYFFIKPFVRNSIQKKRGIIHQMNTHFCKLASFLILMKPVYINSLAKYLPNRPVNNDEMETYLGQIGQRASVAKRLILNKNKIKTRYYAIDNLGNLTHTNAEMTALAIKALWPKKTNNDQIEMLSCGTTSPDQLLPSHAAMVHGALGVSPVEIASFTGACCTGMQALKYGYFSVATGNTNNAVCSGSELLSVWLRSNNYEIEAERLSRLEKNGFLAFDKEFLRWMLSDGAGAALLTDKKNERINLRIDWIEQTSFANKVSTCMYAGGEKQNDGSLKGWHEFEPNYWLEHSMLSLHQDVKLLGCHIVELGQEFLSVLIKKRKLDIDKVDFFLPHLSSDFFRNAISESLKKANMEIPQDKWFTNLSHVGNVGSASPFLMLEDLFYSGRLKVGNTLLMMIPESARFSYAYAHLTVC